MVLANRPLEVKSLRTFWNILTVGQKTKYRRKNSLRQATVAVRFPNAIAAPCCSAYGQYRHDATTMPIMLMINAILKFCTKLSCDEMHMMRRTRTIRYGLYQTLNLIHLLTGLERAVFWPFSRAGTKYVARAFSSSSKVLSAFSVSRTELALLCSLSRAGRVGMVREVENMTPVVETCVAG